MAINLGRHQRELDNAKAEASLKVSHEARSRALEEAREADRRREAAEKRAWELQAWSASLEQQVEACRAALASPRGATLDGGHAGVRRHRKEEVALLAEVRRHRREEPALRGPRCSPE